MKVTVRFPPSPTGFLHIGNARIAIINWLFAKKNHGKIILRFDDTDEERVKDEFKVQMKKDLAWLGLSFDEFFMQSERLKVYTEAFEKCLENGFIYPCYETEEELETRRKIAIANGKPPIYKKPEITQEKNDRTPYFRFQIPNQKITWNDEIQGEISFEGKDLTDPVILRANGNFMYTFCSVVDDFFTEITHIIRGADHITNTAIQMQIFNALAKCYNKNFEINFAHLPLFQSKEGKISKRVGGFSIMEMAKTGYEPEAILNALAKIGLSYYDDTFKQTPELIEEFTISSFNKAQIYFDFAIIESFNKKSLVNKTFAEVKNRLNSNINEHFFEKIKGNIIFLKEVEDWYEIFTNQSLNFINLLPENDIEFLAGILPSLEEKMQISWEEMQLILKKIAPERKGKQLFLPIRIALTGKEHGPEMKFLLEEIGVNTIKIRFTKK